MKRMTASEIRRDWFRVLDEVLAGETIVVERNGRRVVLRADQEGETGASSGLPDYSGLITGDVERADEWSWDWPGFEGELETRR